MIFELVDGFVKAVDVTAEKTADFIEYGRAKALKKIDKIQAELDKIETRVSRFTTVEQKLRDLVKTEKK